MAREKKITIVISSAACYGRISAGCCINIVLCKKRNCDEIGVPDHRLHNIGVLLGFDRGDSFKV
jgi:hypothetical protein